jgi:membrane protein YqaA with SNARE-associated domain
MRIFSPLYDKVLALSRHRHAPYYLGGLSFAESSFFPIPPDVVLAPMSLAHPEKAWNYALITTLASVAGGLLGYLIGYFAFGMIEPWLVESHYQQHYLRAKEWFAAWGFWAIFLAGFSPIPYKVFTITAGMIGMALLPFLIASLIGRGARFYLVALLMSYGGPEMQHQLRKYVDGIGWATVIILILGAVVWKMT